MEYCSESMKKCKIRGYTDHSFSWKPSEYICSRQKSMECCVWHIERYEIVLQPLFYVVLV